MVAICKNVLKGTNAHTNQDFELDTSKVLSHGSLQVSGLATHERRLRSEGAQDMKWAAQCVQSTDSHLRIKKNIDGYPFTKFHVLSSQEYCHVSLTGEGHVSANRAITFSDP